ncbi:TerB family tellurite resistance protein [Reinekea forsetii]|nr:TerB family tellurite resistance protein [Reinekea forsetii]
MIKQIIAFFNSEPEATQPELSVDDAAAVLLIEIMMADHDMDQRERQRIESILSKRLNATESEIKECIDVAIKRREASHDTYQFTKVVNDHWGEQQRYELVVDLWRVAFADGELDKHEDQRVRRLNESLHLHHSHFIKAKVEAQNNP